MMMLVATAVLIVSTLALAAADADAAGWGDPRFSGFNGAKFEVCMGEKGRACQGKALSLITEANHSVNVELNRHAGPDVFPFVG